MINTIDGTAVSDKPVRCVEAVRAIEVVQGEYDGMTDRAVDRVAARAPNAGDQRPVKAHQAVGMCPAWHLAVDVAARASHGQHAELSRPTVSELVRRMAEDDLVERRPSDSDGRSIVLTPTAHAVQILVAFRHGITEVVDLALKRLPAREARQLLTAAPALDHLRDQLEKVATSPSLGSERRAHGCVAAPDQKRVLGRGHAQQEVTSGSPPQLDDVSCLLLLRAGCMTGRLS